MGKQPETRGGVNGTLRRALVHIGVGLVIIVLAFYLPRALMIALLGLGTFCYLLTDLLRLRSERVRACFIRLFKPFMRDYEVTGLSGAAYFLVASLVTLTLFSREIAILAISFLTIGDSLATIIGERYGRVRFFKKTAEGAVACLLGNVLALVAGFYISLDFTLTVAMLGAVVATLVESLPLPVNDNLTIPLLSGTVMWLASIIL